MARRLRYFCKIGLLILLVCLVSVSYLYCAQNPADEPYEKGITYSENGMFDEAISEFNKAIKINPKFVSAYYDRGWAYYTKNSFDKAIADWSKAIELNPEYALAYSARAMAYFNIKEYNKAWADARKAEALGYKVNPKFLENLKKASGKEK